ncbi:hypothetical protein [Noviherbaspirillum galbum]|uniref:Uncharacterized protein n=1 Tax=Noviherbaspirillum galbum TaxID=2709383 RepID=A0A6B3SKV3_9BURK|nr:hypothetical protein [Noviherbaspirillum galbum]NEX61128.1 hypothetical protein [Noviherbaspirillum galbum]
MNTASTLPTARRASAMQGGQALVEFMALALMIFPILLLLPMIGRIQDIAHSTLMASRYAAFDATVNNDALGAWKDPAILANEIRRRFYGKADAPIRSDGADGDSATDGNPSWVDPFGRPLVKDAGKDVVLGFGSDDAINQAAGFSPASDGAPFRPRAGGRLADVAGSLGLASRGILTASVSVSLANLPAGIEMVKPFDGIGLSIRRHTSLLPDTWVATGPAQVQARIAAPAIFPGKALAAIEPVAEAAVAIVESPSCFDSCIRAPQLGKLDAWSDVVPPDSLR